MIRVKKFNRKMLHVNRQKDFSIGETYRKVIFVNVNLSESSSPSFTVRSRMSSQMRLLTKRFLTDGTFVFPDPFVFQKMLLQDVLTFIYIGAYVAPILGLRVHL